MDTHSAYPRGFEHVAIVGLGLIGGSIARGLRAAGYTGRLSGAVASAPDARRALGLGLVDKCWDTIAPAIDGADLIVIAVPPGALDRVMRDVAAAAGSNTVITDTASSKTRVVEAAGACLNAAAMRRFVPGHPIAGTERNGLEAGFAGLFQGRRAILTPSDYTDPAALAVVEHLWATLGANVTRMSAAHHDKVLAATSHLPHVLAYTLVDTLGGMAEHTELFEYAAGGFADFTRIASSDPELWRDIVNANRMPVLSALDTFIGRLHDVRAAIAGNDDARLDQVFRRAKIARDSFATGNNGQ